MQGSDRTSADPQEARLRRLRDRIDAVDRQIQQLLNDRARLAQEVAEVKQRHRKENETPVFYRPEREAQVLRAVMARNQGPLPDPAVARLFREIMSVCLALEQPLRVVFPGPAGSFNQQAAQKHFGQAVHCQPLPSLEQVVGAVEQGCAHYAVVPIESEKAALLRHTLDLLRRFGLYICGEVELAPEAAAQASERCPRFLVVGREAVGPSGDDKTSLLLSRGEAGAEHDLPALFRRRAVRLMRLERCDGGAHGGVTLCYIELEGHCEDPAITGLLTELGSLGGEVTLLGSYPKAVL
jgi:chorismate mutase-like protein